MDENIDKIENSSFIYDIINSQSNFTLFFFSVLFVITILVFSSIEITFTLFVGLIIYVLFIKYYSTMNDTQNINEQEKFKIKKNKYDISDNHPEIIDFLFNIEDLKQFSFILFNELKILIINFVNTYDDCINDYTLVNDYYNTLVNLKLKILITIENFNINGAPKEIVINNKQMIENISKTAEEAVANPEALKNSIPKLQNSKFEKYMKAFSDEVKKDFNKMNK